MNGKVWNLRSAKKAFWAAWKSAALMSLICMSRHYELPEWLVFLSPVYWITASCSFNISSLFTTVLAFMYKRFMQIFTSHYKVGIPSGHALQNPPQGGGGHLEGTEILSTWSLRIISGIQMYSCISIGIRIPSLQNCSSCPMTITSEPGCRPVHVTGLYWVTLESSVQIRTCWTRHWNT